MYLNLNTRQSSKAFKDQTSSLSMNLKKNSKKLTTKIKSSILYIKNLIENNWSSQSSKIPPFKDHFHHSLSKFSYR